MSLPAATWAAFVEEAAKDELTASEALQRAISAYVFVRQRQREGALFLLLAADGTVERLRFDARSS